MMPEFDGFEMLRRMRQREDMASLPVVVLTAKELDAYERGWLTEQAESCLQTQTVDAKAFLDYVRRLLDLRRGLVQ